MHVDIKTISEANQRDHWAVKARRVKNQRLAVLQAFRQAGPIPTSDRYLVTLTRVCPAVGRIHDRDNLSSALKACRDQVAAELGLDDADLSEMPPISWEYRQVVGSGYWVEVEIQAVGESYGRAA